VPEAARLWSDTMSEEQSSFKVTDRRLFNADGTPRELPQDEAPAPAAAATPAPAASEPAATQPDAAVAKAETATQAPPAAETAEPASTVDADTASATADAVPDELSGEAYDETEIPGANDPASFINFLMSIASNAAAALGMMEHPVTGQRGVDLPLGKHWIDVLGMLQEKTSGNLSPQEQQIFTGLLSDLRMQFVSLTRASAPKRPGGFTANDILGGK
jgi:hypothetical protein